MIKNSVLFSLALCTSLLGMEQIEHKSTVPTLKEKATRAVIAQLIEGKKIDLRTQDIADYVKGVLLTDSQYDRIRFLYDSTLLAENSNNIISDRFVFRHDAHSVEWCPNRECALAGFKDGTLLFLNLSAQALENKLPIVTSLSIASIGMGIEIIAWHPEGTGVLSGLRTGSIIYWDIDKDNTITPFLLPAHAKLIWGLSWSPNGRQVLSCANVDNTIRLWDFSNMEAITFVELAGHTMPVSCAAWGHDGTYIISSSCDKTLRLWGLKDFHNISCEVF